jgi:hypothetical protein
VGVGAEVVLRDGEEVVQQDLLLEDVFEHGLSVFLISSIPSAFGSSKAFLRAWMDEA